MVCMKIGMPMDNFGTEATTKMAGKMVCKKVGMRVGNLSISKNIEWVNLSQRKSSDTGWLPTS